MSNVDETRGSERVPTAIEAVYWIHESMKGTLSIGDKKMSSQLSDIAAHGCALISSFFIPKNVLLSIEIDGELIYRDGNKHTINVVGKVVNTRNLTKDSYRLGVSFETIAKEDKIAIKKFVESADRRREPRLRLDGTEEDPKS